MSPRFRFRNAPTVFDNISLFDGEHLLEHMTVSVAGDRIDVVEPAAAWTERDDVLVIRGERRTLLPGFIDAHVHLGLHRPRRVLKRGVTAARDLGWPIDRVRALAEGSGPTLLYAGPMLTATGGYPVGASWAPPGTAREVSSPEEARAAVRDVVEAGASVVKVALDPRGPTLGAAALRSIVDEARAAGRSVTAHVGSLELLERALDAEVGELAHGLWSDEEIPGSLIEHLARATVIVPTLHIAPSDERLRTIRRFVEAGGRVVYGTDMGNPPTPGGIDVDELRLMRSAGMEPASILAAGTSRAAEHLGLEGVGVVAPGFTADLIMVKGDPLDDPRVLAKPLLVMQAGKAVR